jgi:hypothetical protein
MHIGQWLKSRTMLSPQTTQLLGDVQVFPNSIDHNIEKQEKNYAYHCIIQDCRKYHIYVENYGVYNSERDQIFVLYFLTGFIQMEIS